MTAIFNDSNFTDHLDDADTDDFDDYDNRLDGRIRL